MDNHSDELPAALTDEVSAPEPDSNAPVTITVTRRVKPGRERDYEQFVKDVTTSAWRFPGFQSVRVTRPVRGNRIYRFIFRYDNRQHLEEWVQSEERKLLGLIGDTMTEAPADVRDISGTAQARPLALALMPLGDFVKTSVSGIGLLLAGTVIALIMANSGLADEYDRLWATHLTIGTAAHHVDVSLRHWINDGLMALFFFIVGLEIKREVLVGDLRSLRNASLPIAAAVGGAVVPALVYLVITLSGDGARGWGIPMATDTAFSIGILSLMAARVQPMLVVFLTAFAIVDDILAVSVIAVFYTDSIHWTAAGIAVLLLLVLATANLAGVQGWPVYGALGFCVWLAIYQSGIHGTLAGVLVAMTVPARSWINSADFLSRARDALSTFERSFEPERTMLGNDEQQKAAQNLEQLIEQVETPMTHLQHRLNPWVAYAVLPLFAFANAGIPIRDGFGDAVTSAVTWGVVAGLLIGKPIGITLFTWLAVRTGIAHQPPELHFRHIGGVALLGGIGFTMSLFVTDLAFDPGQVATDARVGILLGSIVAGGLGFALLHLVVPRAGERTPG